MINKKEQTYIDKSEWEEGPWKNEPDRISWVDPKTGYDCLIKRNKNSGILCGYVAIKKNHPLYGKSYNNVDDYDNALYIKVHGGLTYANACDGDPEFGICHLTKDNDEEWWFGFDCHHAGDLHPYYFLTKELIKKLGIPPIIYLWDQGNVYRDIAYVTAEVESLAYQLKERMLETIDNAGVA